MDRRNTCLQSHDNIVRLEQRPISTVTPSGNTVRSKTCLSLVPVTPCKPGNTVDIDQMHPQKLLARNPTIQVFCPSLACLPDNTIWKGNLAPKLAWYLNDELRVIEDSFLEVSI